ncbi:hypothetical protein X770_26900 [Mesorhizobium sp. LSJC269B00]|uniref:AAA family ATPase n=1 Tax=Mesorhizobium sp. LSJC269B00 TaxID=1287326 RepID=UPI0003CDDFD5|nr:AAA family ATPase [Mesorhizobium sp. LSJC269B00]ESW82806.1 hypothetical protein X770_26900 [Mesorhizobium sp. LSJC269B00]
MSEKSPVALPAASVATGFLGGNGNNASEARHERRILTALCYDLVGSTDLLGILDIEEFEELISAFQRAARQAVASCSGAVEVEVGDGGVALFPAEIDAKDAASLAIRAGLEIIDACRRVGSNQGRADLHVRVGIATSMTLIQKGDAETGRDNVTGPAFAMATRLQAIAQPDTVLVSEATRNLARRSHVFSFRGSHTIKGFAEPELVWRALSHKREVDRFFAFGRLSSPLVDREAELATIAEAWDSAVAGNGGVVVIEGEAGIGKSRILHEVRRRTRHQRAKLLLFQCTPGGLRSALHPLLQNVRGDFAGNEGQLSAAAVAEVFRDHDVRDPEIIDVFSFLLGAAGADPMLKEIDAEAMRAKANWAVRHSLEALCASGPIVLVVEDIHWIDLTSRQLLAELAQSARHFRALVIVTTRPESGSWLAASNPRHISLKPLNREQTRLAIAAMWPQGKPSTSPELLDVVERVTGGVPLFIEEICQWMAENAASATDRLAQTATRSHASVFESVIEARLETLGPAREVARAAAVAGNRFNQELLRALLPELDGELIANALDSLSEAGFLIRVRPFGVPVYGVRHALIQETIYNATLRKKRQALHRHLFAAVSRNRNLAGWLSTAEVAEHAERAGLMEDAIAQFVIAGTESSSRSAMAEARQILEHALALCEHVAAADRRDALRLSAMIVLGPILTAVEGPNSGPARKLYEDGVVIARRRPVAERAKWFPIYWGWWFTDTVMDGERAEVVLSDLRDVEDAEVQLQARHCVWAIDFNLGRHDRCIAAVDAGLSLYEHGQGKANAALFGGHDARVCGLAHRALSLWFVGKPASAIHSMSEARSWAQQTGHAGSIAHAYLNEAMLHCYRRDFSRLRSVIADLRHLTERHYMPALAAAAQIFEGWCDGNAGQVESGREKMRQGLGLHGEFQTPEDEPVYCGMLAELLTRTAEVDEALALLGSAVAQAEAGGSRFWLAELYRRRAELLLLQGDAEADVIAALEKSIAIAAEQSAVPFLVSTYETLQSSGLSPELSSRYRDRVERAKSALEPGAALIVNPESAVRH